MKKNLGSVTWNAIMKSLSSIKDELEFRLGGMNFSFWFSNWYRVRKLVEQVLYVDIYDLEMRVNDVYLDEN